MPLLYFIEVQIVLYLEAADIFKIKIWSTTSKVQYHMIQNRVCWAEIWHLTPLQLTFTNSSSLVSSGSLIFIKKRDHLSCLMNSIFTHGASLLMLSSLWPFCCQMQYVIWYFLTTMGLKLVPSNQIWIPLSSQVKKTLCVHGLAGINFMKASDLRWRIELRQESASR